MVFTMVTAVHLKLKNTLLQLCIIFIFLFNFIRCDVCQLGLDTPGYTLPRGDINVEYGNPLDITCILNDDYVEKHGINSSSNLYFTRDGEDLPAEMITLLDSKSIRLHIDKPDKTNNSMYTCKLRNDNLAVCLNTVIVGVKPQMVDDFECVGYNYENLTCSWSQPDNYIKTNYSLTYYFPGRASRESTYSCPDLVEDPETHKMSCFWNIYTLPFYRQAQRTYHFILTMTNKFGVNQLNRTFSHYAHVLSGPPENLTAESKTTESIYLRWSVPTAMLTFPPGLQHRVLYQSEVNPKGWEFGGMVISKELKEIYFNLTGLKYAHKLYDIRVSSRTTAALPDDESMWSKNTSLTERTASKEPGAPPKTTLGTFEFDSSTGRDVYLYWQEIPNEIQNGEGFTYEVKSVNHPGDLHLVEQKNAYARFQGLDSSKGYKFLIWSKNDIGKSENFSVINIPAKKIKEPSAFTKIAYGDGKYQLSWEHPKTSEPIVNYTIFWCAHDRDRPYQCSGYLNWTVVPAEITVKNLTVPDNQIRPKIHQFAIAANTLSSSSGMTWAACTVIPNKSIGKMKNVWINNVGSNFIEVGWKLDCSDRIGSVEGFVINYCPILSPTERKCNGSVKNVTVHGNADLIKGSVTGLKPYTTYMLTVSVITKPNNLNPPSDALLNTTLEGAPDSPRNLKIHDVTNSSITLSWQRPAEVNGILKYYILNYNNESAIVDPKQEGRYVLSNLRSYEYYSVSVAACTVACSSPSPTKRIRTAVGYPGKTTKPYIQYSNDSTIVVAWSEPEFKRGENDQYEVQLKTKLEYGNNTLPVIVVRGNNYTIKNCGDGGRYNTFYISVRAVNIINDLRYDGPWSEEFESYCQSPPDIVAYVLAPICVVLLLACFYMAKRFYICCQKMRDVEVKLPPGLAPVIATEMDWIPRKPQDKDDLINPPPPDEQLLLRKIPDRNSAIDSSGCSSGHESVTSSIDSSTRIPSPTDSGTEQPNISSTEEVGKSNTIRHRKLYVTMPENTSITPWANKTNTLSSSYCKLGVDPNTTNIDSSPAYVPAIVSHSDVTKVPVTQSAASTTTPYVLTGDISKTSIHGYVPLPGPTPSHKNTAYVMAGSKPSAVPELIRLDSSSSTSSEDKLMYVQVADCSKPASKSPAESKIWHQPVYDPAKNKLGYVSIGDAPPPAASDAKSVCYSHKNVDSNCLKED
ncbi:cytokine receptor [Agrilus planipennis]|uniref:Cytokine receptor n=1 Tax=Agrilus planipennis TaxID=224129 RepID=A0A1W4X647_AGRPL|nr:cytokine receptor [Agrilus planipennis]